MLGDWSYLFNIPRAIQDLDTKIRDGHAAVFCPGQLFVSWPPTGSIISSPGDPGSQQQDPRLAYWRYPRGALFSSIVSFFSRGNRYPDSTSSLVSGQVMPGDPGRSEIGMLEISARGALTLLKARLANISSIVLHPRWTCSRFELSVSLSPFPRVPFFP